MLWVHATLVHASLSAYQRFERELSRAEQESYYRDMATVAQLFGTPAEVIPPTLAEFREYFAAQIAGPATITVTRNLRARSRQVILHAPLPAPMRTARPGSPARDRRAAPADAARRIRVAVDTAGRAAPLRPRPSRAGRKLAHPSGRWATTPDSDSPGVGCESRRHLSEL